MQISSPKNSCIEAALTESALRGYSLEFGELLALTNHFCEIFGRGQVSKNSLSAYLNSRQSAVAKKDPADFSRTCGELPQGWISISHFD